MSAYEIAGLSYLIGLIIIVGMVVVLKVIKRKRTSKNQEGNNSDKN